MSYNYNDTKLADFYDQQDQEGLLEQRQEYSVGNDEELFGGYGIHFDCYSTFDSDDYEYQQGLYNRY